MLNTSYYAVLMQGDVTYLWPYVASGQLI